MTMATFIFNIGLSTSNPNYERFKRKKYLSFMMVYWNFFQYYTLFSGTWGNNEILLGNEPSVTGTMSGLHVHDTDEPATCMS